MRTGGLVDAVRRWVRKIWDARGGGFYACGFVVTFVYLETTMLVSDVVEADSVGGFISGQVFEIMFRYLGESIGNTIQSFLWPLRFVEYRPPWGIAILLALYLLFANFVKEPLQGWLFGDDGPDEAA